MRSVKIMYRYAKTYKVGKTEYVLFVRTFNASTEEVEKELDKVAKEIKEDYAKKQVTGATPDYFEYLNKYVKGEEQ